MGFCTPECASQSHHFDCREEQGRAREAGGKENWKRKIWQDLNFPGGSDGNKSVCENAGDPGSIPGLGRSPGRENDNPLQYSCLENSMGRGAWRDTAHRSQSWTRLRDLHFHYFTPRAGVGVGVCVCVCVCVCVSDDDEMTLPTQVITALPLQWPLPRPQEKQLIIIV